MVQNSMKVQIRAERRGRGRGRALHPLRSLLGLVGTYYAPSTVSHSRNGALQRRLLSGEAEHNHVKKK